MLITKKNELGKILISGNAVENIVGYVLTTCYGVVGMANKNRVEGIAGMLSKDKPNKGIKVEEQDGKLIIDLHILVEYGINIKVLSENVINDVKYFVENFVGYQVGKVNIFVDGIRVD